MITQILPENDIDEAVRLLSNGDIVAVPTETVYGLAADAENELAVHKIFQAKGRPLNHPLIVHIDSYAKIFDWAETIPINATKLAEQFWPGPLTMILKSQKHVSGAITGGMNTVALRLPDHNVILKIIQRLGKAVVAPSANTYQKLSPTKPEHVLKSLGGKIAAVIDGGPCRVGMESTIIDVTHDVPVILRPGAITAQLIEERLNIKIETPEHHNRKVSGNKEVHYRPEKPLLLRSLEEIKVLAKTQSNIFIIHYSDLPSNENTACIKMPENKVEYARLLYDALHSADDTNVSKILVEKPPSTAEWAAINDRLKKASTRLSQVSIND